MAEPNTRRIVLLGKTGSGKSSLANTLFGGNITFRVNDSANSGTKLCVSETKCINGRNVQLVDTPGFFDTDPKSTELSPELLKCIVECAPGPHAFLLVLKMEKFTLLEQATVALMVKYFSKEALKYTTVVFTRGDDLPPEETIEEWVKGNDDLKNLVEKCGGRCHVFDNKYWNNSQDPYRNNQYQIQQLLETIDQTMKKNGGPYTNEILQQVNNKIQEEAKEIEKSSPGKYTPEEKEEKAKEKVLGFLKKHKVLVTAVLLGAFIGGIMGVGLCFELGALAATMVGSVAGVAGGAAAGVGAAMGAADWRGVVGGAVGVVGGLLVAAMGKGMAAVVGGAVGGGVAVVGGAVGGEQKQCLIEPSPEEQIERYVDDVQLLFEQIQKIKKQYLV